MKNINFKKIIIIVLSSFAIGILFNILSLNSIPWIKNEIEIETVNFDETGQPPGDENISKVLSITLTDFFNVFGEEGVKIIDARDQWDFEEGHIQGAINIPEYSFEPKVLGSYALFPNDMIIIYCGEDDCDLSKRLAIELQKLDFTNVYVFIDGFEAWLAAELPIEKGESNE